ncbi:glycine-rich protein [Rhodococcoides fascians]|uniref:glycine-rich protein n=1 Tax=Rhodococcoides fascians TaxID=1828 RepID=UPI00068A456E|nr:glycine-rich protein [Rhodococcus fascians]
MNTFTHRRYALIAAVTAAAALLAPIVASADPLSPECVQENAAGSVTCTYTQGVTALTLPDGVDSVQIAAVGGRGGIMRGLPTETLFGRGASVTATVPMPDGVRVLYAAVGGNGTDTAVGVEQVGFGGANGGGFGGTPTNEAQFIGAGGGGASDVRFDQFDRLSRILVAGGGGGAVTLPGADAVEAASSAAADGPRGGSGTATVGGAGGAGQLEQWNGKPGSVGVGGDGGYDPMGMMGYVTGGGGGGGWYGGGGGAADTFGSGGGGSSLVPAGGTFSLTNDAPSITISYQIPSTPQLPSCTGSSCLPNLFGSS